MIDTIREAFDRWKGALLEQDKQVSKPARHRQTCRSIELEGRDSPLTWLNCSPQLMLRTSRRRAPRPSACPPAADAIDMRAIASAPSE